jgi:hypothetical protein
MGIADAHAQKADLKTLSTCRSRLSTKDLMQVVCPFRFFDGRQDERGWWEKSEAALSRLVAPKFWG